jgi:hypothetical protein
MSKKENHIAEPFKLTVFRSFEEMKATPFSFPSNEPLTLRQAEREKAFAQLRSNAPAKIVRRLKKANKKTVK